MNDYSPFPTNSINNNSPPIPQQTYPFNNGTTPNQNNNNNSQHSTSTISMNDSDDTKTDSISTDQSQSSIINHKLKQLDINPTNTNISTTNNNPNTQFINSNINTNHTLINTNNNDIDTINNILSLTQTKSPSVSTPRNSLPKLPIKILNESKSLPNFNTTNTLLNPLSSLNTSNNPSSASLNDTNKFEPSSLCTNDPGAPIISLDKAKREFKTVSQAAFRFQFICDSYRRCKLGTVKEKDFSKLEDVINYVHDQLIKRRHRNSQNNININPTMPSKSPIPPINNYSNDDMKNEIIRPLLCNVSSPICSLCNKSFPSNHCYTTCNHPLCIKCLVNIFNRSPKNPRWYMCGVNGCRSMLPPEAHFLVLSYKPSVPSNTSSQLSETKTKILYKKMLSEYIRVRNISYKNMLKVVGEYFSSKLQYYERWRKCENCDFGFLADPDVSWYQVFELKCVVCNVIQRVQLLGPNPCHKLTIKNNYYPNDLLFKTLIFVRHGEAQNNITPSDPNLRDPNLTNRGKEQCKHLKKYFGNVVNVQLILCSVMNRCIQTAIIGIYKQEYKNKVPFIVLENLRERLCPMFNRRENISVKKDKYKGFNIDFNECKCDEDLYFDKEKKHEKYEHMNKRAWQFYKYLMRRKEQTIAIVSHEGMLQCLTNIIDSNDKCLRKSFKNAEARLCFLTHRK